MAHLCMVRHKLYSNGAPSLDAPLVSILAIDIFLVVLPLHCISNLPLGVTNEGREAIKLISGAVAGDSRRYKYASPDNRQISGAVVGLLYTR